MDFKIQFVTPGCLTYSKELGVRIRVFFRDSIDGDQQFTGNSDARIFLAFKIES
jgi:hypothetical protein